jgi:hypothetical protein
LALISIDYVKVWYAALKVWEAHVSNRPALLERSLQIYVLSDFGVVLPLSDQKDVASLRAEMEALLQTPQHIRVQLCRNEQECVSSRVLTVQKYPNARSYSLVLEGQAVLISDAPQLILVKDPKDLLSKEVLASQSPWERMGLKTPKAPVFGPPSSLFTTTLNRSGDRILVGIRNLKTNQSIDLFSLPFSDFDSSIERLAQVENKTLDLWNKGVFFTSYGKSV